MKERITPAISTPELTKKFKTGIRQLTKTDTSVVRSKPVHLYSASDEMLGKLARNWATQESTYALRKSEKEEDSPLTPMRELLKKASHDTRRVLRKNDQIRKGVTAYISTHEDELQGLTHDQKKRFRNVLAVGMEARQRSLDGLIRYCIGKGHIRKYHVKFMENTIDLEKVAYFRKNYPDLVSLYKTYRLKEKSKLYNNHNEMYELEIPEIESNLPKHVEGLSKQAQGIAFFHAQLEFSRAVHRINRELHEKEAQAAIELDSGVVVIDGRNKARVLFGRDIVTPILDPLMSAHRLANRNVMKEASRLWANIVVIRGFLKYFELDEKDAERISEQLRRVEDILVKEPGSNRNIALPRPDGSIPVAVETKDSGRMIIDQPDSKDIHFEYQAKPNGVEGDMREGIEIVLRPEELDAEKADTEETEDTPPTIIEGIFRVTGDVATPLQEESVLSGVGHSRSVDEISEFLPARDVSPGAQRFMEYLIQKGAPMSLFSKQTVQEAIDATNDLLDSLLRGVTSIRDIAAQSKVSRPAFAQKKQPLFPTQRFIETTLLPMDPSISPPHPFITRRFTAVESWNFPQRPQKVLISTKK